MNITDIRPPAEPAGNWMALTTQAVERVQQHIGSNDLDAAVRVYEQSAGKAGPALLQLAPGLPASGQELLANMFATARDYGSAARVLEIGQRASDAALMYELSNEYDAAARCFSQVGDYLRAGAAFERAGRVEQALALYEQANATDAILQCLARQQRFFDAAMVCRNHGDTRQEVDMLHRVPLQSAQRVHAVSRLADLLTHFGRGSQAVQIMMDTVRQHEGARTNVAFQRQLLALLEATGNASEAAQLRAYMQQTFGGQEAVPSAPSVDTGLADFVEPTQLGARSSSSVAVPRITAPALPVPPPVALPPNAQLPPAPSNPFDAVFDAILSGQTGPTTGADPYAALKNIPLFAELSLRDMQDLFRISSQVCYPPHAVVIEQGVPGPGLTVILQGNVEILKVEPLTTKSLATLGPGDYVGEVSLVDSGPTSARVVTKNVVTALFVGRDSFNQYLYTRDTAALRILRVFTRTLCERLRQANLRL